jgi:hypothetical protein
MTGQLAGHAVRAVLDGVLDLVVVGAVHMESRSHGNLSLKERSSTPGVAQPAMVAKNDDARSRDGAMEMSAGGASVARMRATIAVLTLPGSP